MTTFSLTNNPGSGLVYLDETEPDAPDFDVLFAEPTKRHRWGKDKRVGSFVSDSRIAECLQCGMQRDRRYHQGERWTLYREPEGAWRKEAKTPPCPPAPQRGAT